MTMPTIAAVDNVIETSCKIYDVKKYGGKS